MWHSIEQIGLYVSEQNKEDDKEWVEKTLGNADSGQKKKKKKKKKLFDDDMGNSGRNAEILWNNAGKKETFAKNRKNKQTENQEKGNEMPERVEARRRQKLLEKSGLKP